MDPGIVDRRHAHAPFGEEKVEGAGGFEPPTCRSAVDRSTTELTALTDDLSAFLTYQLNGERETAEARMDKERNRNLSKNITKSL